MTFELPLKIIKELRLRRALKVSAGLIAEELAEGELNSLTSETKGV